jgi:hypothetical protein
MTDLAIIGPGELAEASDASALVLHWCEQGAAALAEATTLEEGRHVLGAISTLEHATRVRDVNAEAAVAASALRVRAERRMGELVNAEREAGRLATQRDGRRPLGVVRPDAKAPPTLADHGISRDQAAEFVRLAEVPEDTFAAAIEDAAADATAKKGLNVTRAGVLRRINPEAEKRPDERWLEADRFITTAKRLVTQSEAALAAVRFGIYPGDDLPLVPEAVERTLGEALTAITKVRAALNRKEVRHG